MVAILGILLASSLFSLSAMEDITKTIFWAVHNGTQDTIKFLETHPRAVDKTDQDGCTPLALAAACNYPETVRYLILVGAPVDYKNKKTGRTALIEATRNMLPNIVEILLASSASIDIKDNDGMAAEDYARALGENGKDIVNLLAKEKKINLMLEKINRNTKNAFTASQKTTVSL